MTKREYRPYAAVSDEARSISRSGPVGPGAQRNDNVLQRCFRDLHAAAQHVYFSPASWKRYTKVLLGTEREQLFML